jgi:hypothetical protein
MRRTLTDRQIQALKPKAKRYVISDPDQRGMYLRVMPTGQRSFVAVAPSPHGKQIWATIGDAAVLKVAEARERARECIRRIRDGLPAFEQPPTPAESFEVVADRWLKRHVRGRGLRSAGQLERLLEVYVFPTWKALAFTDIKRSDVAALLDQIEDQHGARQAIPCWRSCAAA